MSRRTLAHVIGYTTIICLGIISTAQALPDNSVYSPDIVDGEVKRPDLAADAVNSTKVANGTLLGADLAINTVTGAQIAESGLNLAFNCGGGMVKAQALVRNAASIPSTPTTSATYLWYKRTCGGGIDITRLQTGVYRVRLFATGATMAQVTPYDSTNNSANVSSYGFFHDGDGGLQFSVYIRDVVSGAAEDGSFSILGY
jgi:hypothetical protein